jgi:hypothetical protein
MATKKKMLMKGAKRTRRFDEGGSTDAYAGMSDAQKQWLGGADPTDPYILARMRRAVPDEAPSAPVRNMSDESYANRNDYNDMQGDAEGMASNQLPARTAMSTAQTPVKTTRKPTSITQEKTKVTATVPKDYSDVNSRRTQQVGREAYENMQRLKAKDKPLEEVHPEDYLPGGILKNLFRKSSGLIERNAMKKAEDLAAKNARATRASESGAMRDTFNPDELRPDFKKGGKVKAFKQGGAVKTSASKRGDGCATKGFTRGKLK